MNSRTRLGRSAVLPAAAPQSPPAAGLLRDAIVALRLDSKLDEAGAAVAAASEELGVGANLDATVRTTLRKPRNEL